MPAYAAKAPAFPWRPRKPEDFNRGEGVVVMIGAAALGALAGVLAALIVGRMATVAIQAGLWLAFGLAFHVASKTLADLVRARAWTPAAFYVLHLFAFAPWLLLVLRAEAYPGAYWLGPLAVVGTLAVFVLVGRPVARIVYRTSAHVALIAGVTALQSMLLAFVN